MKRLSCGLIVLLAVLAGLLAAPKTSAAPSEVVYQNISLNCETIRLRLKQVQINDSLTRVNYGQAYESVIEKVLTPANTRLVANRYDASSLVATTTQFNNSLQDFRNSYRAYKNKLDDLVLSDCENNPIDFYTKLEAVRSLRSDLNRQLKVLDGQIDGYKKMIKEVIGDGRDS